jgi:hypothetical protein
MCRRRSTKQSPPAAATCTWRHSQQSTRTIKQPAAIPALDDVSALACAATELFDRSFEYQRLISPRNGTRRRRPKVPTACSTVRKADQSQGRSLVSSGSDWPPLNLERRDWPDAWASADVECILRGGKSDAAAAVAAGACRHTETPPDQPSSQRSLTIRRQPSQRKGSVLTCTRTTTCEGATRTARSAP